MNLKINWRATIGLITAIIFVSLGAFLGWHPEPRVNLDSCGYMVVKEKMIEVHSPCKIMVKTGLDVRVYEEDGRVVLFIPEGWKWRIVP